MNSLWNLISDCEEKHKIDPGRCRYIISQANSIEDVRHYLEKMLSRLKRGDLEAIKETWSVAVPLAYRLAIDDTANNYRIASQLKEAALWLEQPIIMAGVHEEIEWLFKSACGASYSELKQVQEKIDNSLRAFSKSLNGNWRVYYRQKSVSSVLSKLTKIYLRDKQPKNRTPEFLQGVELLLFQFQEQVSQRIVGNNCFKRPYKFSDIKWLLPDLLAFTLQLTEEGGSQKNLGSAKARYKSVYQKLRSFPAHVFYGPSYSNAWHMNRMVCYMDLELDLFSHVAFELFVRTDLDYFIGYSNYWRYKDVALFAATSRESSTYRRRFVKRIRSCVNFSDVQAILFEEITTGQLDLF